MFQSNLDVKLPGVNTAHIKFNIPRCLKREHWVVHITGKWFNYGILFIVMLLDLNMWKNQIFYKPIDFGQYVGPDDRIYSVKDDWSLSHYKNETIFSYHWRTTNYIDPMTNKTFAELDTHSNSRYRGYSLALRGLAFIPSLCILVMFGVLIIIFGREGTKQFETPKKSRSASEKVVGLRLSKVDPDMDETDGTRIEEVEEDDPEEKSPRTGNSSDAKPPAEKNYGSTGTSPPPTKVVPNKVGENNDTQIA